MYVFDYLVSHRYLYPPCPV